MRPHIFGNSLREKLGEASSCYSDCIVTVVVTCVCHIVVVAFFIHHRHREVVQVPRYLTLQQVFLVQDRHIQDLLDYLLESCDADDSVPETGGQLHILTTLHCFEYNLRVPVNGLGVLDNNCEVGSALLEDI